MRDLRRHFRAMIPKTLMRRLLAGKPNPDPPAAKSSATEAPTAPGKAKPKEIGGPAGPEPTRYGDWERNGRCIDF